MTYYYIDSVTVLITALKGRNRRLWGCADLDMVYVLVFLKKLPCRVANGVTRNSMQLLEY